MKKKIIRFAIAVFALPVVIVGGFALYRFIDECNQKREIEIRFENECLECFKTAEKLFEKTCLTEEEVNKYLKQTTTGENSSSHIRLIAEKNGLMKLSSKLSLQIESLAENWWPNWDGADYCVERRIKSGECRLLMARIEEFSQMFSFPELSNKLTNEQISRLKQDIKTYKRQVNK